ncbi:hypothetical protein ISS85_03435 [Candidatus Microgenomates bacterium]|nr:hypothetical protein [Candidatus Microgenomates bacterium]
MSERIGNPIFDENGVVRQSVHHNLVTLESLRDPEVRANIPSLQDALEAWRFQDSTDSTKLLRDRILRLPRAHTAMEFVTTVYKDLSEHDQPLTIIDHEPGFSVEENMAILAAKQDEIQAELQTDQLPGILKTISLRLPYKNEHLTILVSGVGDFQLAKQAKREIAKALGLSLRSAKKLKLIQEILIPQYGLDLFLAWLNLSSSLI